MLWRLIEDRPNAAFTPNAMYCVALLHHHHAAQPKSQRQGRKFAQPRLKSSGDRGFGPNTRALTPRCWGPLESTPPYSGLGWIREKVDPSRCGGPGILPRIFFLKTQMLNPAFWWLLRLLVGSLGRVYPSMSRAKSVPKFLLFCRAIVALLVVRTKNNKMEILKQCLLWNFLLFENYGQEVGGPMHCWENRSPRLFCLWPMTHRPSSDHVGQICIWREKWLVITSLNKS